MRKNWPVKKTERFLLHICICELVWLKQQRMCFWSPTGSCSEKLNYCHFIILHFKCWYFLYSYTQGTLHEQGITLRPFYLLFSVRKQNLSLIMVSPHFSLYRSVLLSVCCIKIHIMFMIQCLTHLTFLLKLNYRWTSEASWKAPKNFRAGNDIVYTSTHTSCVASQEI